MCSAIFFRITESGLISTRDSGSGFGIRGAPVARVRSESRVRIPSPGSRVPDPGIDVLQDVVLRHASAETRSVNLRDVHVVVARDASHERRRTLLARVVLNRSAGGRGATIGLALRRGCLFLWLIDNVRRDDRITRRRNGRRCWRRFQLLPREPLTTSQSSPRRCSRRRSRLP